MNYLANEFNQRIEEQAHLTPTLAKWLLEAALRRSQDLKDRVSTIVECV